MFSYVSTSPPRDCYMNMRPLYQQHLSETESVASIEASNVAASRSALLGLLTPYRGINIGIDDLLPLTSRRGRSGIFVVLRKHRLGQ